jgi:hypothetical protein
VVLGEGRKGKPGEVKGEEQGREAYIALSKSSVSIWIVSFLFDFLFYFLDDFVEECHFEDFLFVFIEKCELIYK